MAKGILTRSDMPQLGVHAVHETVFLSQVDGRLCQWIELDLSWAGWRANLGVGVRAGRRSEHRELAVFGTGRTTVRCPAPCIWPGRAVDGARMDHVRPRLTEEPGWL